MRSNIIRIVVAMAAMSLSIAPTAWAAADDVPSVDPWAGHPLIGAWSVDTSPDDAAGPSDTATFRPDGTMIETGPVGRGAGFWVPTGDHSVSAVFNVPWTTDASFDGFVTVRTYIVVDTEGDSFAGTYTLEGPAAAGLSAAATVPESVVGSRLHGPPDPESPPADD